MHKVLIADSLSDGWQDVFANAGDIQADVNTGLSPDELKKIIADYHGLIVRSATQVTRDIVDAATSLRVIGRAGAGVDNIDIQAATERGIVVANAPGGNTISTAEHTMAMILSLSRNVPQATASLKAGKWERKSYTGVELDGKVLGVLGVGRVGLQVARRCRAFGMRVLGYDPILSAELAAKDDIHLASFDEIYAEADYITLHVPLTDETRNIIGAEALAKCKAGVRIINCARGGLIDQAAVLEALNSGKLAGVALDAYETEPPTENDPLIGHPNVICTPHLGASTHEAQEKVARQIAGELVEALRGRPVRGAINLPPVDPAIFEQIQPYLLLGEKVGRLISQISDGRLEKMAIEYQGEVLEYATSPMTSAVLKGAVSDLSDEPVTYVNAPLFARRQGLQIEETRSTSNRDYTNLITVRCQTSQETTTVVATVFGRRDPRLVQLDDFEVKAKLEGDILISCNKDVPGVVGRMGSLLAESGINIADLALGRESKGGSAIMIFNVDTRITDEVLARIEADPVVLWAKHAEL